MLRGDLGAVAAVALRAGARAWPPSGSQVGRPLQPMLAAPGDDVDAALARIAPAAVEYKLDGARLQVHRRGDDVLAFTRSLDDVTARVPEVVEAVLRAAGCASSSSTARRSRCAPTGARSRSRSPRRGWARAAPAASVALTPLFFDLLHVDGDDLLDRPGAERAAALAALVPAAGRVPRVEVADAEQARAVLRGRARRGPRGRRSSSRWRPPTRRAAAARAG